jgi:hypothetical protein
VKLVIVVEVEGIDPARVDPHEVAQAMLEEEPQLRYFYPEARRRFVRAEWEDVVRREGGDTLIDDEDE